MGCNTWTENMGRGYSLFPQIAHALSSAQILLPESPKPRNQLLLECNPCDSYYTKRKKGAISIAFVSLIGKESHNQAKRTIKHGITINELTKKDTKTCSTSSLP